MRNYFAEFADSAKSLWNWYAGLEPEETAPKKVPVREMNKFKTDDEFAEYATDVYFEMRRAPLEQIEIRISEEVGRAFRNLGKEDSVRRGVMIEKLLDIYAARTKPEDRDPRYSQMMKTYGVEDRKSFVRNVLKWFKSGGVS